MFLLQLRYFKRFPTHYVPISAEAACTVLSSLVVELLFTGIYLVAPSCWLTDRLYEAGADDTLTLPFHVLGSPNTLQLTTLQSGQCIVTALYAMVLLAGFQGELNLNLANSFNAWFDSFKEYVADLQRGGLDEFKPREFGKSGTPKTGKAGDAVGKKQLQGLAVPRHVNGFVFAVSQTKSLAELLTINGIFIATGGNLTGRVMSLPSCECVLLYS